MGLQGVTPKAFYLNPKLQKLHDEARIFPVRGKVSLHVHAYPPDRRKRDLDNLAKALFDALGMAGVFRDDFQIDRFSMARLEPLAGGLVCVEMEPLDE